MEFTRLKDAEKYCPACNEKIKNGDIPPGVQDRHLFNKQKRQTSE